MNEAVFSSDATDNNPEATPTTTVDEITALREALAAAEAKAQNSQDQYIRAHAEMDNVRKRVERDVVAARKFALEGFASEMLGICDSLELGLVAANQPGAEPAKLIEGMQLTQQQLVKVLERFHVKAVDPQGQPFNPDLHQAISMVESADAAPNTVLTVMQKGYTLHERLLRPAMVMVAKAPTQPAATPTE